MRHRAGLWVLLVAGGAAAHPLGGQTRATIYSDGRIFVRRVIEQTLVRGTNVVMLPVEFVSPGSIIALDSGVTIVSARTPLPASGTFAGDPTSLLRRMVGRPVSLLYPTPRDTLRAIVLSADPPRYRVSDGSVMVAPFGVTLFPSDMVESERATIATIESRDARARFEVGYTMIGVPWQAQYVLMLSDGGRGRLTGAAVVQSDGMALDSTEFSVVEGQVARVPVLFPVRSQQEQMRLGMINQQPPPAAPPTDSIRLYPIVGRHPLRRGEVVNLPLVAEGTVQIARVYVVPGIFAPLRSPPQQSLTQSSPPTLQSTRMSMGQSSLLASLRYRLTGDSRSPLARPLPSGIARIYGRAGAGGVILLAEANVPDPSPGGLLELVAGPTTDIVAARNAYEGLVEQDTLVTASGSKTVRATATVFHESVRLQNRTGSEAVVEIVEQRGGAFTVLSSSVRPEPLASGGVRFQVTVPARGEALFTARLRVQVP